LIAIPIITIVIGEARLIGSTGDAGKAAVPYGRTGIASHWISGSGVMTVCVLAARDGQNNYTVMSPTIPGCTTTGRTLEEVLTKHRKNVMGRLVAMNMEPTDLTFRVVQT